MPTSESMRGAFATDAGMHALWSPEAFSQVHDYQTWARELEDDADITRHISAGDFVPINIGRDMVAEVEVRMSSAGVAALSERERRYLFLASEPYRFVSRGAVAVGGIEHVAGEVTRSTRAMPLAAGQWSVVVHMINWDDEPGAFASPGKPAVTALPDYLVTISPAVKGQAFRAELRTFPPPGSAR